VHLGRLGRARHHDAVFAGVLQVPHHLADVEALLLAPRGVRRVADPKLSGKGRGEGRNASGTHPEPMVRTAPRRGIAAFYRVKPAHRVLHAFQAPALREGLRVVGEVAGTAVQKVGVETHDDLGRPKLVSRPKRTAEGLLHAETACVVSSRRIREPFKIGKAVLHALPHGLEGGRVALLHQHGHLPTLGLIAQLATKGDEVTPRSGAPILSHRPGAIGVVQVEHRGLLVRTRARLPGRVIAVAFDLGRTPLVALGHDGSQNAPERHARGVVIRNARHHRLLIVGVGQDFLLRPPASGEARHGHGRPHELQELATRRAARRLAVSGHKLREVVPLFVRPR